MGILLSDPSIPVAIALVLLSDLEARTKVLVFKAQARLTISFSAPPVVKHISADEKSPHHAKN
jgi:hypothetical protein